MPIASICIIGVDPSLGRLDYASLPQQALMEMFTDGITNREEICGETNEIKDLKDWKAVKLKKKEVIEIYWDQFGLEGTLNLQWLPSTLQHFWLNINRLTGSLDLTSLPEKLVGFYVSDNGFTGEVDLTRLPSGLLELMLTRNELSGKVDLTRLPETMKSLYLNDNTFAGETDFSKLPAALITLDVSATLLEGEIFMKERTNLDIEVEDSKVKIIR